MSDIHRNHRPLTNRDELAFRIWCGEVRGLPTRKVTQAHGESHGITYTPDAAWERELAMRALPLCYEYADAFLDERDRQLAKKAAP